MVESTMREPADSVLMMRVSKRYSAVPTLKREEGSERQRV
jgi:hypothetical protein